MSQVIAQPIDCSTACVPSGTSSTPGPQGNNGNNGTNGADGTNAWTTTADGTGVMPDGTVPGTTVTLNTTSSTAFMAVGDPVFVETWGTLFVTAIPTDTSVTLSNPEDGTGVYADNAAPGLPLAAGQKIVPSGVQGPEGPAPANIYLQILNNLNDLDSVVTARSNLGLGTVATFDQGVTFGKIPNIDGAGGIGAGDFVTGTGTGIEGKTAAQARTAIGLVLGIANTNIPPVDQVAGLTVDEMVVPTASGLKSVDAATARGLLGVSNDAMLLFTLQFASGDGGVFATGGPVVVPLNTEVVDTGGNGSIAANKITLSAGTYRYQFSVLAYNVGWLQGLLYNDSDGDAEPGGFGNIVNTGASTGVSTNTGRFTIAGSKDFYLKAINSAGTGLASDEFGKDPALSYTGVTKAIVYSWIALWKE